MGKLLTIAETSRRLGLTLQTMRNWVENGYLTPKRVGKSVFFDEDTINALSDTAEDVKRQKESLDKVRAEYEEERKWREYERFIMKTERTMGTAIARFGFFKDMCSIFLRLMAINGSITEKEADLIRKHFNGTLLEDIAADYNTSRESIRLAIGKAINKCQDLTVLEKKIEEMEALRTENNVLQQVVDKVCRKSLQDKKAVDAEVENFKNDIINDKTLQLLSVKIEDCGFSVRARNCLWAAGCKVVADICRLAKTDYLRVRNAGKTSFREVDKFLTDNGLRWQMNIEAIYKAKVAIAQNRESVL